MSNSIIRAYDAEIDSVNKTDRSMVARINTAGLDRYKTVIDPKGARLDNYRRNPVVLWEHGKDPRRFTDPIGRNVWVRSNGGNQPTELLAKTQFLDDDFSRQRFEWYRDGVLNAFSVNILPDEYGSSPPTKEEMRGRPELADCSMVYRAWDLAEYSATTVPGNADALADRAGSMKDLVSRGLLWVPEEVQELLSRTMTDSLGGLEGGGATVQERYIRKCDGKWCVYSEDGKKLGEHDSEDGAKNQLKAVEANKGRSWIDWSGGRYYVRGPAGEVVIATTDEAIANDVLESMTSRTTFETLHFELSNALRTNAAQTCKARDEFKEDIRAYLDLMIHGRV